MRKIQPTLIAKGRDLDVEVESKVEVRLDFSLLDLEGYVLQNRSLEILEIQCLVI